MAWAPASRQDGSYPRPQLVRPRSALLDRRVGFAFDDSDVGRSAHWELDGAIFDRAIQLPFAPEAPASGIADTGYHAVVWYRIPITAADLADAGLPEQGERVLLHLGAVDSAADVWCDGRHVGRHEGGQTAFHLDLTDALAVDRDEHVVVVRAEDDPHDASLPRGKQDWLREPHQIWYERITGIWRTVWLEAVSDLHIAHLGWTAQSETTQVVAEVELSLRPSAPVRVRIELAVEGQTLGVTESVLTDRRGTVRIGLERQRNRQAAFELFWSPDSPRLIDARVTLLPDRPAGPDGPHGSRGSGGPGGPDTPSGSDRADRPIDSVTSYLGLRSVDVAGGRFRINGRAVQVRAVLEQGYWPDSHYTAPSPDAMRREVELILRLGFNTARIHQKVEDPRFVYWADRLGLLLWGETAAALEFSPTAVERLTADWVRIVRSYRSHPSIVTWVPFNESWGIQEVADDPAQAAFAAGLTALTRALDPTRPVVSNDGWEHVDSDLLTVHDYEGDGAVLAARYADEQAFARVLAGPGPAGRVLQVPGTTPRAGAPVLLTEFGGVRFVPQARVQDTWGYTAASSPEDFEHRVAALLRAVHASSLLAGFCYTQLTDTRQEANGLCDEHRRPKLPVETLAALVRGTSAARPAPAAPAVPAGAGLDRSSEDAAGLQPSSTPDAS